MTYTDKDLDNVLDISHIKIKVVIPEYCVTLIFVHKMAKENKIFVVFDESKFYFVNQDLNLKNVLGTGDQEPVMNVLKKYLKFDKPDKALCCEICKRAKQTREPFPLSDHVSSSLRELVHLDLWGPYRVTSSKGFRYFLTVVDDYTRAVLIPNDDERVDPNQNCDSKKSQSVSSSSFESGGISVTADFPINFENDADSSDNNFATKNEEDNQNLRRSPRQSIFPKNYNDFVVDSKVKYGIE
ncbi:ribonuclease H-like domain-containing protein, partial [Tanacetum coccineum]